MMALQRGGHRGFESAFYILTQLAMLSTFANLNVGEDVHVDEVRARHHIDGGEKHVASEQLLQSMRINE